MNCSKCGAENPDNAQFCSKCGAELAASVKTSKSTAKSKAEPAKAKAGAGKAKAEVVKTEEKTGSSGGESSTGMSANIAGLLCYVAVWVTGIVFVLLEKKSTFVKFHAWQSIMTFGVLTVANLILMFIPVVGWILSIIIRIIMLVLWIILMIKAGQGKMWKVPWAGNWAEKQANK